MDWISFAHQLAANSLDPSTKVGAVVVGPGLAVGIGWNRLLPGTPEDWWHDREKKYLAVVHAEEVALLHAGNLAHGSTLICTHHLCRDCAKMAIAAGVVRAVFPEEPWRDDPAIIESCRDAIQLLNNAGIEIIHNGTEH